MVPVLVRGGIRGAIRRNRLPMIKIPKTGKGQRKAGFQLGSRRILKRPRTQRSWMKVVGYAERETMKLTRDVSLARASADQGEHSHASPVGGAQMNRIVTSQCSTRAAMGVLNLLVSTVHLAIQLKARLTVD
jgi:hypothetical protein